MNKRFVIVAVFVLAGIAFLFVRSRVVKPSVPPEHADRLPEKTHNAPVTVSSNL